MKELRRVHYEATLNPLCLFTLARRRIRANLICMYKLAPDRLNFPCDGVFAAPTRPELAAMLSRFTSRGVKPDVATMRSVLE